MSNAPAVSVGLPVFNGAATVERAIASIRAQTLGDFELIISDNASTDDTERLCRRHADADARLHYTRQSPALTGFDNFRYVLGRARAPYFMWLAADDHARPALLQRAASLLDTQPDVVCAVPRVLFVEPDGATSPAAGTYALRGSVRDNLCRYLHNPIDNSRFYGVFRRSVLERVMPDREYYGFDWTVAAGSLLSGGHAELDEVLLLRDASDPMKYVRLIDACFPGILGRLFPLWTFTRALVFGLRAPLSPCIVLELIRHNVGQHVAYCEWKYPRYGRAAHRVAAGIERAGTRAYGRAGRR
jgi:glycosyltransferase involved in cell wall biosynthesis